MFWGTFNTNNNLPDLGVYTVSLDRSSCIQIFTR